MSWNPFKSSREREAEAGRARRRAIRNAQRMSGKLEEEAKRFRRDKDAAWNEAKRCLQAGDKAAADRHLRTVREKEGMIGLIAKKKWVYDRAVDRMEMAQIDGDIVRSLGELTSLKPIDVEQLEEKLFSTLDTLGEIDDTASVWQGVYDGEAARSSKVDDDVPEIDQLRKVLGEEVAVELTGKAEETGRKAQEIGDEIAAMRKRLNDALEERK